MAVSPDTPDKTRVITEKADIDYTLLSDPTLEVARGFGVAYRLDPESDKPLMSITSEAAGTEGDLLPVPSVFLLEPDGTITFTYVNPDYRIRVSSDVLLEAAKSVTETRDADED